MGAARQTDLWLRRGYPRAFFAADDADFWAMHNGAELDLLQFKGGQRTGVAFKRADAPQVTPSMRIARHDLQLDRLHVVDPGDQRYALGGRMEVLPLAALLPP